VFSLLTSAVGHLPLPVARGLGRRAGDLAWLLLPRRRATALANVAVAFPDLAPDAQRQIARGSYRHLGMVAVEVCRALHEPIEATLARVTVDGIEHLTRVMASHGRAIVVTGHVGNWELLALAYRLSGVPLSVVVRPLDTQLLAGVVHRFRGAAGATIIDKREAVRPVLEALRRGGLVAILLDQNTSRREGVFVPFFGRLASTSRSVATLALRTNTPVLPIFVRRQDGGEHRVTVRPAITPEGRSSTEEAVVELTRRCTEAIEAAIREAPEQWLWMHARWRTRPAEEQRT
jgi:KDO2-lipid IV(A) lauroyltransferase